MQIPAKLQAFVKQANAEVWLQRLPNLIAELSHKWNLEVGEPYPGCGVAYVAPAQQAGRPVVLKVQWPHPECAQEALALKVWDGAGAIRLLAVDDQLHALLLERCNPGEYLADAKGPDPMAVVIQLLSSLCVPTSEPFTSLWEEAMNWRSSLHGRWQVNPGSCEPALVDAAYATITELADSQGPQVLLHQDLHGHNVLSARRADWLAIDPKPLLGELAFALSPIVRSQEFGPTKADLNYRLDRLTEAFAVDRQRARGWAFAQSIAWSFGSDQPAAQQEIARWLLPG